MSANPPGPASPAPSPSPSPTSASTPSPAAASAAVAAPLPVIVRSRNYPDLSGEYQAEFEACTVLPQNASKLAFYTSHLAQGQGRYHSVADQLHIPWYVVGIIHGMECSFNFNEHLHNGDPLTARTVHVPANRPPTGNPPFTWEQSALDALTFQGFAKETDWSPPHILFMFERYNGLGYRMLGVPSPYLWSYSNLYTKGKYVADGHFDPNAVSQQCGAGVVLKAAKVAALF